MIRQPNNQVYKTVVLIWISLSLASVIMAAVNWAQLAWKLKLSAEAVAMQNAVEEIFQSQLGAETGVRGFVVSGLDVFLEPFDAAQTNLPVQFDKLAELTRQNPVLLKQVMDLRGRSEVLMENNRKVVSTRREQGDKVAAALIKSGEGKAFMDAIRSNINEIKSTPASLLSIESGKSRNQLLRASLTSMVAGAIGVGAGLFAFYLAGLSARHQQRERELLETNLQVVRASQEKSAFLANVSHEIRTPMNAILGFAELLTMEVREPKHRQYLQSIRTSAASLLRLINDILDISKVEAGALELRPEPTDAREICDFVSTLFKEPMLKKGLTLECRIAEDLPKALLVDRIRLRQILINVVGNAVKFTDKGTIAVHVTWEKEKQSSSHITLILEVQDTGVGIPQDKLDAIFKPFVQAGGHREKERMGTGLGLAIVNRLVQHMGGTVTVASVVGQGSAFHLRFPGLPVSARLPLMDSTGLADNVDFNALRPAKILVVDDNEMNYQLIAGMFSGTHHQLEYGMDGNEAVDKTLSFRPDLLLMDIRMPNLDGREALEKIRQTQGLELFPVIAITASSLLQEEQVLREKFSGYIRKPFSRRELFDELSQFLPKSKPASGDKSNPSAAAEPVAVAQAWRGLATQLRGLESQEWPGLRDSMAVNETLAFARKLEALARETNCEPLLTYAETLAHHAESYAVDLLEVQLRHFPGIIDRIERSGI